MGAVYLRLPPTLAVRPTLACTLNAGVGAVDSEVGLRPVIRREKRHASTSL